jgi:adenosylcobinamide-GDP ribazoletransferase
MIAAVALLTRLPVRTNGRSPGAAAFGVVGALLGLAAAGPALVFAPLPGAVLALAVLAIASGALHLDGLADTADALAAPTPDAAERARRDPRVGPAGAVAIVLTLATEAAALADVAAGSQLVAAGVLVAAAAGSRAAATLAPFAAGSPRPGFGQWFAERTTPVDAIVATTSAIAVAVLASLVIRGPAPGVAALVAMAAGVLVAAIVGRLRDGLDGDGCGTVVELSFAAGLLAASVAA